MTTAKANGEVCDIEKTPIQCPGNSYNTLLFKLLFLQKWPPKTDAYMNSPKTT